MMSKSYDAVREATGERTSIIEEIAHRIGLKPGTVYRWRLPYENPDAGDTGSRNPFDTGKFFMEACITLGRPKSAALAPLDHLNHHFGRICFDIPDNIKTMSREELMRGLLDAMKEAGDVIAAYQKATASSSAAGKKVFRREMAEIEREVWEAVTAFMSFRYCLKESAK